MRPLAVPSGEGTPSTCVYSATGRLSDCGGSMASRRSSATPRRQIRRLWPSTGSTCEVPLPPLASPPASLSANGLQSSDQVQGFFFQEFGVLEATPPPHSWQWQDRKWHAFFFSRFYFLFTSSFFYDDASTCPLITLPSGCVGCGQCVTHPVRWWKHCPRCISPDPRGFISAMLIPITADFWLLVWSHLLFVFDFDRELLFILMIIY